MAPTSYCYSCVSRDEFPKMLGDPKLPVWVGILLFLLVVSQATLMIALQMEVAGGCKQQDLVQKLQEEIKTLNQKLQRKSGELEKKSAELEKKSADLEKKSTELEQLRKGNVALVSAEGPPDSGIILSVSVATVLLPLSLLVLLA